MQLKHSEERSESGTRPTDVPFEGQLVDATWDLDANDAELRAMGNGGIPSK